MVDSIGRDYWQDPAKPVSGPARKEPFRQGVIHWEGAGRNWTPPDIPRHLRNLQSSYLGARGYSLGYGFAVVSDDGHPQNGTRWEIRGTDLNMASNPGAKWKDQGVIRKDQNANDWTGSILIIGPADKRVSKAAAQSVRTILAQWHAEAGTAPVSPIAHSVSDYTTCCGPLYTVDVLAGLFDPAPVSVPKPPAPPVPPTIVGDDSVLVNVVRYKKQGYKNPQPAVFAQYSGGYKIWVPDEATLKVLMAVSKISAVTDLNDEWFVAAGPVLPNTPLPYQCDAWGRRVW